MPKTEIDAHELTEGNVQFISLVKRGANRVPFRILKSDPDGDDHSDQSEGEEMLNFGINLKDIFKGEAAVPSVVALVVNKGADLKQARDRIEAAGYSIDKMEETDDGYVFVQEDFEGQATVIKFDDGLAALVSNVSKTFESLNFESTDFKTLMSQEGFFPSLRVAKEALGSTISNIMEKADSNAEAASAVGQAIDDFKTFAVGLVGTIPTQAFKLENAAQKSGDGPASDAKDKDGKDGGDTDTRDGGDQPNASKGDGKDTDAGAADDAKGKSDKAASGDNAEALKGVEGMIATAMTAFKDKLDDMGENMTGLIKSMDEVKGRVKNAEKIAKAADEAVSGVISGNAEDDPQAVKKGDKEKRPPPPIDTAYTRVVADSK